MTLRLLAVIFSLAAAPALARGSSGPVSCEDKCANAKDECGSVCTQYGGPKGAQMCKKGCAEGAKKCQDKCKKKGH